MAEFKLGDVVRDTVTLLEGTITARAQYLHGSNRVEVSPSAAGDGPHRAEWFEESRLELVSAAAN